MEENGSSVTDTVPLAGLVCLVVPAQHRVVRMHLFSPLLSCSLFSLFLPPLTTSSFVSFGASAESSQVASYCQARGVDVGI